MPKKNTVKFIVVFTFLLQNLWAQSPKKFLKAEEIIYNPGGNKPGRFVIAYKDYKDIRLDIDRDGQIDFWYVRQGHLHVSTTFKDGKPVRWYIRKVDSIVREFQYDSNNGKLYLTYAGQRAPLTMGYPDNEPLCKEPTQAEKTIAALGEVESATLQSIVKDDLVDPSCKDILGKNYRQLLGNLKKAIEPNSDPISKCLRNEKFADAFSKESETQIDVQMIIAEHELQTKQLREQSSQHKPLISCLSDEYTDISINEKGLITLKANSSSKEKIASILTVEALGHELLHRIGVFSEEDLGSIVGVCRSLNGREPILQRKEGLALQMSPFRSYYEADVTAGAQDSASTKTAVIEPTKPVDAEINSNADSSKVAAKSSVSKPNSGSRVSAAASSASIPIELTVAQTSIPAPNTLTNSITNPAPVTNAGAQQALVRSATESRGVLSAANNLVGVMSSRAEASTSLASSGRESSGRSSGSEIARNSKRAPASERTNSKNTAADLLKAAARNEVRSNERVVEEITIEGTKSAPSGAGKVTVSRTASINTDSSNPQSAAASGEVANSAPSRGSSPSLNVASVGSSTAVTLGTPASSRPGGTGGVESSAGDRAPTSTTVASPTPSATTNAKEIAPNAGRSEVVNLIVSSNYSQTKAKLKEPEFTKKLQDQKITILDLYGSSYGATKGDVIFLDQGDRFVRQK